MVLFRSVSRYKKQFTRPLVMNKGRRLMLGKQLSRWIRSYRRESEPERAAEELSSSGAERKSLRKCPMVERSARPR